MNQRLQEALSARNPRTIAEVFAQHRNAQTQSTLLLDTLYECTAIEVQHIQSWAEDWLSDTGNCTLRDKGDARWQAMNTVYQIATQAIKTSGTTVRRERYI